MNTSHVASFRVYYEDTDAGGIVYHANYLKFAERARTEWLRSLSFTQRALAEEEKIFILVHHLEIDFLSPAYLDDEIRVETSLVKMKKVTMEIEQILRLKEKILAKLTVSLACVTLSHQPTGWPLSLREKLL